MYYQNYLEFEENMLFIDTIDDKLSVKQNHNPKKIQVQCILNNYITLNQALVLMHKCYILNVTFFFTKAVNPKIKNLPNSTCRQVHVANIAEMMLTCICEPSAT